MEFDEDRAGVPELGWEIGGGESDMLSVRRRLPGPLPEESDRPCVRARWRTRRRWAHSILSCSAGDSGQYDAGTSSYRKRSSWMRTSRIYRSKRRTAFVSRRRMRKRLKTHRDWSPSLR